MHNKEFLTNPMTTSTYKGRTFYKKVDSEGRIIVWLKDHHNIFAFEKTAGFSNFNVVKRSFDDVEYLELTLDTLETIKPGDLPYISCADVYESLIKYITE